MTPQSFKFFCDFLYEKSGLSLHEDKQYLLENRLSPVLRKNNIENFDDLAAKVRVAPTGSLGLEVIEGMTVSETSFFRDRTPFDRFIEHIVPELMKNRLPGQTFRIWSAASSSGQEAYTLAMLCKENPQLFGGRRIEIMATDISSAILEKAKAGIYSQFEVQRGMPTQFLLKYFEQTGEMWTVTPEIKSMVQFQQFNLMSPFTAMPQFDVIFCRNVLIYFDVETKGSVFEKMRSVLAPDGFLVLGAAETTIGISDLFVTDGTNRGLFRGKDFVQSSGRQALSA